MTDVINNQYNYQRINEILKMWNPLLIDGPALDNEYMDVIPDIINSYKNINSLVRVLEDYLINRLGLSYDKTNMDHVNELLDIAQQIQYVLNVK